MTAQRQEENGRLRLRLLAGLMMALLAGFDAGGGGARAAPSERVVTDLRTGLAIGGIDPVAYFTDGQALPGRPDVEASASGVVWRFRNEANRDFFLAHPEIYGPQFGGYDPVDLARGVIVAGRAQYWLIAGQRLYLFGRPDTRDAFAADPAAVAAQARARWPALRDTLPQQ